MIILMRHLAQLFALLLLSQPPGLQAQNTTQFVAPFSTSPAATVPCKTLAGNTTGVHKRLNQYSELVRGRQCIVLYADPTEDLAQLIERVPENTVILLSSRTPPTRTPPSRTTHSMTPPTVKPSSSVTSATGKILINYFIDSEIVLKDGQDIFGAADDGFEIVISPGENFLDQYMIVVGKRSTFQFGEIKDSYIGHLTFWPIEPKGYNPIHSIFFGKCYSRRLIIENNVFHLPNWIGVRIDCYRSLDASASGLRSGPGLKFVNNTVKGETIRESKVTFIPLRGIFIQLPNIKNQTAELAVIENTFQGKMAEAGEFILGPGGHMDIFRNTVAINNTGKTSREIIRGEVQRTGGFGLIGHTDTNAEPPQFNLVGNQIEVSDTAISVEAQIELTLACNHLQAVSPWRQKQQKYSLKAMNPLPLAGECNNALSSNVGMTTLPPTLCQIVNIWTAINDSSVTAISGLTNLEGQFYFDPSICPTVTSPPAVISSTPAGQNDTDEILILFECQNVTDDITSSSAGRTSATTALGIMTTLSLLFIR
ncbi:hypothetical protein [Endozoicomonas sp. ISHI1]|uniref:hypothetical protein n=1 Tax=Endozoicomonas sp. ISHI1 TaxID=2825882 RepID=UPI002148EF08|nr:hypothetical protein [Endozoicomonas sp. ISHI1]